MCPIIFNDIQQDSIIYNNIELDKVYFNNILVFENWVEKTGDISIPSRSGTGWGSSSWKDIGKEIIPLQVRLYFSWAGSGMQYSTSCGGYLSGALASDKSDAFNLVNSKTGSIGINGNGSENNVHNVSEQNQKPIRYIRSGCGGGTGGGSVTYGSSGSIVKWLERPNSSPIPETQLVRHRYLNTDIYTYEQKSESIRLLQSSTRNPLSSFYSNEGTIKCIINCSYFNGNIVLGRNQGDLFNNTHDQTGFYDMVILKNNSYVLKPMASWDYQTNSDVVAGFSPAAILIQNSQDVELISSAIVDNSKITTKNPQTALGYVNGKFIFIASEGRNSNDTGLNGSELRTFIKTIYPSVEMLVLLDGGGSTEMIVDGEIINYLSDGNERSMLNGLAMIIK